MASVGVPTCVCGEPATANGRECGFHFRQRLRSVRLGDAVTETRTKHNYYDREAVAQAFGEDAKEQLWEDTGGHGFVERDEKTGALVHTNYKGETQVASEKVLDFLTDQGEAEDVV